MKRVNRYSIKHEKAETSTANSRIVEEHDLAYYIHDRVELMHQVFSVLKTKDLKAMAPECVRRLSIDDLEELCTEELLGISSKRLLAILDGAEPPSDTESSSPSPERFETISLDSISSGEELLAEDTTKKKHKHKHHNSKSKKHRTKKTSEEAEDPERSKASRAGLTVLELLELQARARAIRAQLQQEQAHKKTSEPALESSHHSDSEVEIKEEPTEVVEISSSEDEKPNIKDLEKVVTPTSKDTEKSIKTTETNKECNRSKKKKEKNKKRDAEKDKRKKESSSSNVTDKTALNDAESKKSSTVNEVETSVETQKVTKRVNDLIITVPQQSSRKIKLNRNKMSVSIPNVTENMVAIVENPSTVNMTSVVHKVADTTKTLSSANIAAATDTVKINEKENEKAADKMKVKDKSRKRQKKKEKRKTIDEDHEDHYEITLQLSDSEKMDLLEDFDRKNYDKVSSSSSDTDSNSDSSEDAKDETAIKDVVIKIDDSSQDDKSQVDNENEVGEQNERIEECNKMEVDPSINENKTSKNKDISLNIDANTTNIGNTDNMLNKDTNETVANVNDKKVTDETEKMDVDIDDNIILITDKKYEIPKVSENENQIRDAIEITNIDDIPLKEESEDESQVNRNTIPVDIPINIEYIDKTQTETDATVEIHCKVTEDTLTELPNEESNVKATERDLSEGEITDQEVEALDYNSEVVCISEDEKPKEKKKKTKKAKKDKKKKSDFQKSADQNFYTQKVKDCEVKDSVPNDDDLYEILELSDDSSCYEVEGTILSKEPTAEEIAALSAKIDEIERDEVTAKEQTIDDEKEISNEETENMSWRDRYLDSKKVKRVLSTSNILNALRKKNKELKKKIEESNKPEEVIADHKVEEISMETQLEEGTIEHYNTLQGSTKYVDPVQEPKDKEMEKIGEESKEEEKAEQQVTGEMKKDAKQLLKMYKRLLKYNDINKQKDPSKKKNKKKKKKDKGDKESVASVTV